VALPYRLVRSAGIVPCRTWGWRTRFRFGPVGHCHISRNKSINEAKKRIYRSDKPGGGSGRRGRDVVGGRDGDGEVVAVGLVCQPQPAKNP
jgi:hypothetical protein